MSLSRYLISVIFFHCLFHNVWPGCVFQGGKYDLSALDLPGGWSVAGPNINGTSSYFKISVCGALNYPTNSSDGGCKNSSVCFFSHDQTTSFGDTLEEITNYAIAALTGNGFTVFVRTKINCGPKTMQRTSIKFACGPNLGVPELVLIGQCQVNFQWTTSAACQVKPKTKQVPCYALDEKGEKRDLSHLIKPTGGYFVNTPNPAIEFVINVCSDILPDDDTLGCPANSSACRIIGSEKLSFGSPQEALQYKPDVGLILTYKASGIVAGCSLEPKTTLLFKCPNRGYSQPPKVISNFNCQYEVEWETEYACPENSLKGDIKTCQFTAEIHGVEIDLSPLRQETAYIIKSSVSNTTEFALSVCGGLGNYSCGDQTRWKSMSVCMLESSNHTAQIVGTMVGTKLMYADDEVILTYPKGSLCESSIEHSTVINFICDPKAVNNGSGVPQHVSSDHCVHYFDWPTKHACLKHPLDTPCSVTYENKKISLQKLLLVDGDAWEAIDRRYNPSGNSAEYYINVCGQISNLGNFKCGEGSSACAMLSNGTYLNLGNFTSSPIYDVTSNSVRLEYSGGDQCKNGKQWNSVIDFICRPGHINTEPVLVRVDEAECRYEFEWQTAEACPLGMIEGTGCKVYDASLGINYDLSPLKSQTYEVDNGPYTFYLGVCEPAKDTPCSKNQNSSVNVGVCQVDQSNQQSWNTGESNSNISYMDGVVNLTYLSGDPYNDANKTARMTIVIFICDFEAGKGHPHFVEEVNFAYVFHWYTDLVCQPPAFSTECLVHDPTSHLIYDLSGLSSRENWVTHVSDDEGEKRIYLNICRPLSRPSVCDSKAAACVTEMTDSGEKVVVSNIGRPNGSPVLESSGHISLTYTQGDPCILYGKNTTYQTVIHFLCGEQFSKIGPMFLHKLGACEYTFLWTTSAACPTGSLQAKNSCELTDPDSGFTFDLSSLQMAKQPYSLETSSGTFQFNVCGKIMEGCTTSDGKFPSQNISVCQVDKDGNKISEIATANNYSLSYSQGQDLTLTYNPISNSSKEEEVAIRFPCYNGTVDPKPKFIRHEDGRFIFEMPTPLTCIPGPVDCTAVDSKGNEYDLNLLSKFSDGNWEVADFRPENRHIIYHINFCRPLNKVKSYKCPGGASSACQTDTQNKEANGLDLGSQIHPPTVSDTGTVVIRFTNGSFCQNGQFRRSTTINLFCNIHEGELTFIGETPECEYVFSLDTPVACAIQSRNGSDCKVREPQFGYTFDLNPLKSKNNNYNITNKEYKYFFNVCDRLNGFKNECMNSSVCQTKPSDEKFSKSLGLPNDKLIYRKGVITLEYNSGNSDCHGKYNRSTYITFTCDHESKDIDGPEFIGESDDCTYSFEWPTIHACPPFDVVECSVIDKDGKTYDLSRLSLVKSNYLIKNPLLNNKTFVLNLCRSVVHTPDSLCPYTAASCLVDNSGTSESISLGRVNQGPYFDGDKIKIKYTSGDHCDDEKTSTSRFWETVIEFSCSPHVTDGEPQFIGKDGCTYYFDWDVAFACSEIEPVPNTDDCTTVDPTTGFVYNLTALSNRGIFKTETATHRYYMNICKSNATTPCGSDVGVCQEEMIGKKRNWKAGQANSKLQFIGDVLVLNYTNGDFCHNNLFQRNSIIEFHCGSGIGEPKFLFESSGCTYYFSWKTELACQNSVHMHCAITNGTQYYDLSSLAETYHVARSSIVNDYAEYYVSVCKPLPIMINNNHCPSGAGICRVTQQGPGAKFGESLGKPEIPPFVDFMDQGTIVYTNGSTCKSHPDELLRSRIIFLCDSNAGMGQPIVTLADGDECIYIFEWRTSLVCPEKPDVQDEMSCNYTDHSRGIYFDLSPLKNVQPYKIKNEKGNGHFLLQMCSSLRSSNISNCKDAGVCLVGSPVSYSHGVASTQKFAMDGNKLRLTFKNGDDCPSGVNGKFTSEILFVCDPLGGYGQPILYKQYTCLTVFMWKTALVCQNMQQQCSFDVNGSQYNFNLLSSLSHNWDMYDEHNNTYWINLCRGIQPTVDTHGCMSSAAVCMKDHDSNFFTLGTIQTMQVKSINSTDLLLTFESGDIKACSSNQTPLPKMVTTRLFMRCGSTIGHPKKFSGPDSECFYDFLWESSLACAERNEIVILEKDGIIKDERFGFTINISSILNSTFKGTGKTGSDDYIYEINLSGLSLPSENPCAIAAVCQTKSSGSFFRDIGSFDTRLLVVRGTELHLTYTSRTKPCGKNPSKNVTTVINMQCVSVGGLGNPEFVYESGECDYVFEWETTAVCPVYNRITPKPTDHTDPSNPVPNPYKEEILSSHSNAAVIVGVIAAAIVITAIGFIVSKPERRALVAHRFRGVFGRVNLPYFRYRRSNGERLVLVDATEPHPYDDDRDVEMLS